MRLTRLEIFLGLVLLWEEAFRLQPQGVLMGIILFGVPIGIGVVLYMVFNDAPRDLTMWHLREFMPDDRDIKQQFAKKARERLECLSYDTVWAQGESQFDYANIQKKKFNRLFERLKRIDVVSDADYSKFFEEATKKANGRKTARIESASWI